NKGVGASLAFTPSTTTSFTLNGLTSNEPAGLKDQTKTVIEPILSHTFNPAFTGVLDANFDFGQGTLPKNPSKDDSSWSAWGIAGYGHLTLKSTSALTARLEYWDDNDGFLTGIDGQKGYEATLTYGLKSAKYPNAETRLEYRYDHADKKGLFLD